MGSLLQRRKKRRRRKPRRNGNQQNERQRKDFPNYRWKINNLSVTIACNAGCGQDQKIR